jgi:LysM repeat protein
MNAKRLVLYLFLNAAVSASVAFGVLWLWDRTHPLLRVPPPVGIAQATETALPLSLSPTPAAVGATEVLQPTPTVYVVKPGDTLGTIAQRFGVTVDEIMAANGLTDPNVLSAGESLTIPVPGSVPPTAVPSTASLLPTNPPQTPLPTATQDPNQPQPNVTIREVRGAGVLADEVLVVASDGGSVDLAGWTLRDETGRLYTFPTLKLLKGGTVSLHTAAGSDTVTDLFWGQTGAVWASGKSALLSDASGNLRARYTVP